MICLKEHDFKRIVRDAKWRGVRATILPIVLIAWVFFAWQHDRVMAEYKASQVQAEKHEMALCKEAVVDLARVFYGDDTGYENIMSIRGQKAALDAKRANK